MDVVFFANPLPPIVHCPCRPKIQIPLPLSGRRNIYRWPLLVLHIIGRIITFFSIIYVHNSAFKFPSMRIEITTESLIHRFTCPTLCQMNDWLIAFNTFSYELNRKFNRNAPNRGLWWHFAWRRFASKKWRRRRQTAAVHASIIGTVPYLETQREVWGYHWDHGLHLWEFVQPTALPRQSLRNEKPRKWEASEMRSLGNKKPQVCASLVPRCLTYEVTLRSQ